MAYGRPNTTKITRSNVASVLLLEQEEGRPGDRVASVVIAGFLRNIINSLDNASREKA